MRTVQRAMRSAYDSHSICGNYYTISPYRYTALSSLNIFMHVENAQW